MSRPASKRIHDLQDALRALADAHGLENLLAPVPPGEVRDLVVSAVHSSEKRAAAIVRAVAS